jgi:hypothetical protein
VIERQDFEPAMFFQRPTFFPASLSDPVRLTGVTALAWPSFLGSFVQTILKADHIQEMDEP